MGSGQRQRRFHRYRLPVFKPRERNKVDGASAEYWSTDHRGVPGCGPCCACGCSANCRPTSTGRRPRRASRPAHRSLLAWPPTHRDAAGGSVRRPVVADVLNTTHALRCSALWELRSALGTDGALLAGRERIALRCETDLGEFEAPSPPAGSSRPSRSDRGPLLRRDCDDDWVLEARDELAGAASARPTPGSPRRGNARRGVVWARRRLQLDPLDEDAARGLMRRSGRGGDRAGRWPPTTRLSDRLREALGLAPSQQTRTLAAALREVAGAGNRPRRGPPLIGRDVELRRPRRRCGSRCGRAAAPSRCSAGERRDRQDAPRGRAARARPRRQRPRRPVQRDRGRAAVRAVDRAAGGAGARARAAARRASQSPRNSAGSRRRCRAGSARARWPGDVPGELARARLFEAAVELAEHATADRRCAAVRRRPRRRRADARARRLPRAPDQRHARPDRADAGA